HLRAESRIDAGKRIAVLLHAGDPDAASMLREQHGLIAALVRAESVSILDAIPDDLVAARGLAAGVQIALPLEGLLDFAAERERIGKELDKVDKELATRSKKLANHAFVSRAPAEVVDKERRLQQDLVLRKERLARNLANLGST
ncbi:MAG: valine--tRNA ligase, partial [Acidobacteriota bacterium]